MPPFPIRAEQLRSALAPEGWLGPGTPIEWAAADRSLDDPPVEEWTQHFARRGLTTAGADDATRELSAELLDLDRRGMAHALGLLLSADLERMALGFLPPSVRAILADDTPRLDHIGIEVFGRLEWCIEALAAWAASGHFALGGYRIFPSVQVHMVLARHDRPATVRIARVYVETEGLSVNLELFEVGQPWTATVGRQLALYADQPRDGADALAGALDGFGELPLDPVAHLALTVDRPSTVREVHELFADPGAHAMRLYDEDLCYNAGDQSLNTKLLARSGALAGRPVFGRILELICYGVPAVRQPRPATASDR